MYSTFMGTSETLSELVTQFAGKYRPDLAGDFQGIIHLVLTGKDAGSFTLECSDTGCTVSETLSGHPDCEIRTNADAFRRIVSRQSSPQEEFIMGHIYISNLQVIRRIGKAFT